MLAKIINPIADLHANYVIMAKRILLDTTLEHYERNTKFYEGH